MNFKESHLECHGLTIRYVEAGEGKVIVIFLEDTDNLFDDMTSALAARYRVITLATPALGAGQGQDFAAALARALIGLGIASFSAIGVGRGATLALAQALATPEQVQQLVLLSPPATAVHNTELGARLREITAPSLILVGTRDHSGSRDAGHICREHIPTCHLLLVYEAGRTLIADRLEACLSPINEFLERGEGFIVFHESQVVRP